MLRPNLPGPWNPRVSPGRVRPADHAGAGGPTGAKGSNQVA